MLLPLLFLAIPWALFLAMTHLVIKKEDDVPWLVGAWTIITAVYLIAVALFVGASR
jgi:hypothetical protein